MATRQAKVTYVNTLEKGNIGYYFEIFADNNEAYLEKHDHSKRDYVVASGWFTVEEARRYWKTLKAKGFVIADDPYDKWLLSLASK